MAKCYDNFSIEELIELLNKQDKELALKKYGLVWDSEKEPEQVVLDCENNLPILQRIPDNEIKTDNSDYNILIEGDNYHSLTVLNYTHKEKVDLIYIDPPYNTGKKDEWKYNDNYVTEEDGYRHSKWLNFMEKRLRLSHNLLKPHGVIFISIDDNEQANLRLLCDKIFGPNNFIGQITREAIKGGSKSKYIRSSHDYVIVYAKNKDQITFSGELQDGIELNLSDENGAYAKGRELNKWGADSRREDSPTMWFPIKGPNGEDVYPIRNDGSEGRWRWGKKKLIKAVENNNIIFEKRENRTYIVYEKIRDNSAKIKHFTSLFKDNYTNDKGAEELKKIFNTSMSIFDYAKPVELIYDLLVMAGLDDDAIVLDFFAGSGTTAQAVQMYNFLNDTNIKFILATNNENNICTDICYPRIKYNIEGYNYNGVKKTNLYEKKITKTIFIDKYDSIKDMVNQVVLSNKEKFDDIKVEFKNSILKVNGIQNVESIQQGYGGNLQYFITDLIPVEKINKVKDFQRQELTLKAGEMIAIKENTFNNVELNDYYQIFINNSGSKQTAIYFREDLSKFDEMIEKLSNIDTVLYIFSYGRIDKRMFGYLNNNISIEDIPEPIIDIYKEINQTLRNK